jgi:hypothetical protein
MLHRQGGAEQRDDQNGASEDKYHQANPLEDLQRSFSHVSEVGQQFSKCRGALATIA